VRRAPLVPVPVGSAAGQPCGADRDRGWGGALRSARDRLAVHVRASARPLAGRARRWYHASVV